MVETRMDAIRETARQMAAEMASSPDAYREFGNREGLLGRANKGEFYIEATVPFRFAQGAGQIRVVCLCRREFGRTRVVEKYYSLNHYGTGEDRGNGPAFRRLR